MKMNGGKLVMVCLPLFFFCFDICDLWSTPPPKPSEPTPTVYLGPDKAYLNRTPTTNDTLLIKFSSICAYRGTAMSIKLLVLNEFRGINVFLLHHAPAWTKYLVMKLIPTVQVGIIMIVMAGGYMFLELGIPVPSWHNRLCAHKFAIIAIPWLLGNIVINYLQNTESLEIYFNDELVFCKLQAGRFPKAHEIREIIRNRIPG